MQQEDRRALQLDRSIESTRREMVDEMDHTTLLSSTSRLVPRGVDMVRFEQCQHHNIQPPLLIEK